MTPTGRSAGEVPRTRARDRKSVPCGCLGMSKPNPNSTQGLRVRSNVRADKIATNHGLRVRSKIRAGGIATNHGLRVRSKIRAGKITVNHGTRVRAS